MDSGIVHPLPARDPVSGGRLIVTELQGEDTGITIRGRFEMPRFAELNAEQSRYLETFLRCRGMLNSVERELGISYPTARARLDAVLKALDLHAVREETTSPETEPEDFEPATFEPIQTEPVAFEPEPVEPEPVETEAPGQAEEAAWTATESETTVFENPAFEEPSLEPEPTPEAKSPADVDDSGENEPEAVEVVEEPVVRRTRDEILTLLELGEITPEEAKREMGSPK